MWLQHERWSMLSQSLSFLSDQRVLTPPIEVPEAVRSWCEAHTASAEHGATKAMRTALASQNTSEENPPKNP